MSNKVLIAESGSTKTNWVWMENGGVSGQHTTSGLNPNYTQPNDAVAVFNTLPAEWKTAHQIYFYGSGLGSKAGNQIMQGWLSQHFQDAAIALENYLVAAARSLCANQPGIVAILGTGSNACRWDGATIDDDQHSLGYILGDEGSGFSIGKHFIADYFYGQMPDEIAKAFSLYFPYTREEVLAATYHAPAPNRFIANAARFAVGRETHLYIRQVITTAFQAFIKAYLLRFKPLHLPVHCTCSIAAAYADLLREQLSGFGLVTGNIMADPLNGLIEYHKNN